MLNKCLLWNVHKSPIVWVHLWFPNSNSKLSSMPLPYEYARQTHLKRLLKCNKREKSFYLNAPSTITQHANVWASANPRTNWYQSEDKSKRRHLDFCLFITSFIVAAIPDDVITHCRISCYFSGSIMLNKLYDLSLNTCNDETVCPAFFNVLPQKARGRTQLTTWTQMLLRERERERERDRDSVHVQFAASWFSSLVNERVCVCVCVCVCLEYTL